MSSSPCLSSDSPRLSSTSPVALNSSGVSALTSLLPSESVSLFGPRASVSALALSSLPSRPILLTGDHRGFVHSFDFSVLNRSLHFTREAEPDETQRIVALSWNTAANVVLECRSTSQCSLLSPTLSRIGRSARGDMYLFDVRQSRGHSAAITGGTFSPVDCDQFLTAAADGTARLWNIGSFERGSTSVIKPKSLAARRLAISACAFSPDGATIAAAASDGSIRLFSSSSPNSEQQSAIVCLGSVTSLDYHPDGELIAARCRDSEGSGSLTLLDRRALSKPVHTWNNLPSAVEECNSTFLTGSNCLLTGTSAGMIEGFSLSNFSRFSPIAVSSQPVNRVLWSADWQQLFLGLGDSSIVLRYSPRGPKRGVIVALAKEAGKRNKPDEDNAFQDRMNQAAKREREAETPKQTQVHDNAGQNHVDKSDSVQPALSDPPPPVQSLPQSQSRVASLHSTSAPVPRQPSALSKSVISKFLKR